MINMRVRGVPAVLLAAGVSLVLAVPSIAQHSQTGQLMRLQVLGLETGNRFGINQVYNGFGCTGKDESPGLKISGVPTTAKSLAITIFDPDAPTQSGWWHWVAYNLPVTTTGLAENASATGLPSPAQQGPNDFGMTGFGGACPPAGSPAHHYRVILWAEKVASIGAPKGASAALIDYLIEANALAHKTVVVKYGR